MILSRDDGFIIFSSSKAEILEIFELGNLKLIVEISVDFVNF